MRDRAQTSRKRQLCGASGTTLLQIPQWRLWCGEHWKTVTVMKRMKFCSNEDQKVHPELWGIGFLSVGLRLSWTLGVLLPCWSRKRQRVCEKMNGRLQCGSPASLLMIPRCIRKPASTHRHACRWQIVKWSTKHWQGINPFVWRWPLEFLQWNLVKCFLEKTEIDSLLANTWSWRSSLPLR